MNTSVLVDAYPVDARKPFALNDRAFPYSCVRALGVLRWLEFAGLLSSFFFNCNLVQQPTIPHDTMLALQIPVSPKLEKDLWRSAAGPGATVCCQGYKDGNVPRTDPTQPAHKPQVNTPYKGCS